MAARLISLVVFVLVLGPELLPGSGAQQQTSTESRDFLVQFAGQTPLTRRQAILASVGAASLQRFSHLNAEHGRLAPGRSMGQTLADLARYSEVVAAQPDFQRQIVSASANDPYWLDGSLWGLERIGVRDTWASVSTGGADVVIADIDTGVNYNHPDLAPNMWRNPNEIPGNRVDDDFNGYVDDVHGIDSVNGDADPMDDHGHGTHTAGTFAAVGNNAEGVAGINWNAKILACKFLRVDGVGSDSGAVACFNYIVALKQRGVNVRVTNNSWGSLREGPATVLQNAINAAGANGIINVFAAGNSNSNNDVTPYDPASLPSSSIVSVAASDTGDNRAGFSNYGATSVDIAAPGVSILSTVGGGYSYKSGTSMAAPHVAGAAAVLAAVDPTISVDGLKQLLMQHVDPLPAWSGLVASAGRVNLFRAASSLAPAPPPDGRINFALAANGAVATASSAYSGGYGAGGAINGDRRGAVWGSGGGWNDGTAGSWPDWLEVTFSGARTIAEVDVFSVQDSYQAPAVPTSAMTFTLYGLRDFEVQYWTGTGWASVPGASASGNVFVWRQFTFAPITTTRIRVLVTSALNSYSRIAEVEAYGNDGGSSPPPTPPPPPPGVRTNVALASLGAQVIASSTYPGYGAEGLINGERSGAAWGAGGGWNDGTADSWPDWIEVHLNGTFELGEVDVFSVQDSYQSPLEPTPTMTFTQYGLRDFQIQYWTGSAWAPIPGAAAVGNNLVWRQFVFAPVTTSRIRIWVSSALNTWSRMTEVEAYTSDGSAPPPPEPGRFNVALAANGGTASASSVHSLGYGPAGVINGDRRGANWGSGGGWNDATADTWPDWIEVTFAGARTIDQIDLFSVQDVYWAPADPVAGLTFSLYGLRDFQVQYWTGSSWAGVPGAAVMGNDLVWRQFTFAPVTTMRVRVLVTGALNTWSRVAEIEVWGK